jgi:hypothetical protein
MQWFYLKKTFSWCNLVGDCKSLLQLISAISRADWVICPIMRLASFYLYRKMISNDRKRSSYANCSIWTFLRVPEKTWAKVSFEYMLHLQSLSPHLGPSSSLLPTQVHHLLLSSSLPDLSLSTHVHLPPASYWVTYPRPSVSITSHTPVPLLQPPFPFTFSLPTESLSAYFCM